MSALAGAGGHSRKVSLVSATPTAVLPSLRMATELDGAAKGGARRNIDTWYQLLTSLAVSVPSPELAVELGTTTYEHVVSEDYAGAIEFQNPLEAMSGTGNPMVKAGKGLAESRVLLPGFKPGRLVNRSEGPQ